MIFLSIDGVRIFIRKRFFYTLRRLKKILNAKNRIFITNFRIVLNCPELHNANFNFLSNSNIL